jgi:hypothetical protein
MNFLIHKIKNGSEEEKDIINRFIVRNVMTKLNDEILSKFEDYNKYDLNCINKKLIKSVENLCEYNRLTSDISKFTKNHFFNN